MLTNFLEFACGGIESNGNGKRFCKINERGQLLLNKSPLSIGKSPVFFFLKMGFELFFTFAVIFWGSVVQKCWSMNMHPGPFETEKDVKSKDSDRQKVIAYNSI